MKYTLRFMKKLCLFILMLTTTFSLCTVSSFAENDFPEDSSSLSYTTFTDTKSMNVGDIKEYHTIDKNGNPVVVSIELIETVSHYRDNPQRASSRTWKVSYSGVTIFCSFYMTVSNNKVTRVYDDWIFTIGGTYDNSSLTRTTTYGKLSFRAVSYLGIISAKCWLKGTVTGSNNDISLSWKM